MEQRTFMRSTRVRRNASLTSAALIVTLLLGACKSGGWVRPGTLDPPDPRVLIGCILCACLSGEEEVKQCESNPARFSQCRRGLDDHSDIDSCLRKKGYVQRLVPWWY